jgi:capsular exopolysaccharide synthesis family protein
MPAFTGHNDLVGYLRVLWRWKFLFLACVIAVVATAALLALRQPDTYRSTALVGVGQTTVNTGPLGTGASFSTSNVDAIAELVTTAPVARIAAGLMHPPADPAQVAGEVSAVADQTTNFIRISAEDRSSRRAADITNAFAKAISMNRQQAAIGQLNDAIAALDAQLARLTPKERAARSDIRQQVSQLRAARSTQGSNAAILEPATPATTAASTGLRRSLEIAAVIGLLLGFGAVVMAENSDRRLRAPEELEAMTEAPLLATIAPSAFSGRLDTGREDDEAFYMLRAALTYFNTEHPVRSVVVASAGEKEGKTTVSTRLALAAASAGLKVALVDGDLRRGQVAVRLGIDRRPGIGAVLTGERSLTDALVDHPLPGSASGHLTVLPAGPPPPNPAALVASEQMPLLIRRLEAENQLVIVDTPAALAVGDPLPLMRSVSGVILVARMGRSSRRAVRRLDRMISDTHGTLLGVVATAVTRASGYYEGYSPAYYAESGTNGANGHGRAQPQPQTPGDEPTASPAPRE